MSKCKYFWIFDTGSEKEKLLGMTLDRTLSLKNHVINVGRKASQ